MSPMGSRWGQPPEMSTSRNREGTAADARTSTRPAPAVRDDALPQPDPVSSEASRGVAAERASVVVPFDTLKHIRWKSFPPYHAALKARRMRSLLTGDEPRPVLNGDSDAETHRLANEWNDRLLVVDDLLMSTLDDEWCVKLMEYESPVQKWAILIRSFEIKPFINAMS